MEHGDSIGYRGAIFELRGIEDEGDRYTADVVIQWPDGRRIPVRMSGQIPECETPHRTALDHNLSTLQESPTNEEPR